jgi:hypothetical protein
VTTGWASPVLSRGAEARDCFAVAPLVDHDGREDGQESEVHDPLECVVGTEVVERRNAATGTDRDRGEALCHGIAEV